MNHVIVRVPRDPDTCLKNFKNFLEQNIKNDFFSNLKSVQFIGIWDRMHRTKVGSPVL